MKITIKTKNEKTGEPIEISFDSPNLTTIDSVVEAVKYQLSVDVVADDACPICGGLLNEGTFDQNEYDNRVADIAEQVGDQLKLLSGQKLTENKPEASKGGLVAAAQFALDVMRESQVAGCNITDVDLSTAIDKLASALVIAEYKEGVNKELIRSLAALVEFIHSYVTFDDTFHHEFPGVSDEMEIAEGLISGTNQNGKAPEVIPDRDNFAVVRWSVDDVIGAAETHNSFNMTEAQAVKFFEEYARLLADRITSEGWEVMHILLNDFIDDLKAEAEADKERRARTGAPE